MPLDEKGPGFIRRALRFRKYSKLTRTNRIATLLIAVVALTTAIAFSVSVNSRAGGWLWKSQPSTPSKAAESTKNSTTASASASAHRPLGPNAAMLTPPSPTVTASKTDSLDTDVDMDGKADPGDRLKYSVVIGATGDTATGVTFTDTVDPNTTFVAGSLRTTPLARPDSYTATGNVRIQVPAGSGVLTNDVDPDGTAPAISVTAGTSLSAQGGNVSMSADGSFTYNPPAGFEGTDTFTYTLNDNEVEGNNTDTGTVTVTVSGMIWFINNNVGSSGDGRLTSPFKALSDFNAVNNGTGNHPAANDNIFVYESASDYVGPVTLLNGQKFIGQDATDTLASIAVITLAPFSDALPATNSANGTIVNITSAGAGINVAQNNTLRGFTGGNAAPDISGSSFGTLNVSDVTLNGTGQTLNLSTGTLNGSFGSLSSSNSATTGISLTSVGGSLTTGSTTVTNSTGIGINVNTSSANLSFANTSVTGSGGTAISLTTNTGTATFGTWTVSPDSGQRGVLATNNTQTITVTGGTVSATNNVAVEITRASGTTPLSISLLSVGANGGSNGIVMTNTSGSFTITGNGTDTATVGGNASGGTITGTTGSGINLSGVTNISLTSMLIQNAGDDGITGLNVTGFSFTRSRSINNGNAVTERGIEMTNLFGTATITNSLVTGNTEDNLYVKNGSGTLNLTTTGSTYANVSSALGNDGIHFLAADVNGSNNANMSLTVTNCTFNNNRGDHLQVLTDAVSSATMSLTFQNNSLTGDGGTTKGGDDLGGGLTLNPGGTATVNFNISNNGQSTGTPTNQPWTGAVVSPITINSSNNSTMSGTISNNIIGNAAVVDSGSSQGDGINITANNTSDITVAITNNIIRQYANASAVNMSVINGTTDSLNATVTGNTFSNPGTFAGNGFFAQAGAGAGDAGSMCLDLGGAGALANSLAGSGANGSEDFRVRQRFLTTVRLPGYGGANNGDAAVVAFIQGRNTGAETGSATDNVAGGGGGFVGGAACASPALGPITQSATTSSLSAESVGSDNQTDVESDSVLWAAKGENANQQHVLSLTPSEASAMVQAAIARWADAGLSAKSLAKLQSLPVEIADLPAGQIATASSSKITLDVTAAGYGWYFDPSPSDDSEFDVPVLDKERQTTETSAADNRIDLLTVLMRQLGSQVKRGKGALNGSAATLMENTLTTGTRRAPVFKAQEVGKVQSAPATKLAKQVPAKADTTKRDASYVASNNASRSSRVLRNHPMRPAMSFADVLLSIGDLPAGKTITVTFKADVKDPFPGPGAQVCNQGTVSGTNFANVLTDDPAVGGAADPTCTPIDLQADLAVTKTDSPDPVIAGNNLTYTINFVNNGPNSAGATVTDATPAGTTFVSATVTTGTGWGTTQPSVGGTGNVVFSKALVAKDETAVFTIVVKVGSSVAGGSTINNSATAATTGATDPVPGNNTGTASTSVIAQADLSITKTDGATTEIPGTSISYTITVTNSGPSDANGVSVADMFPSDLTGITFTSTPAGGATGNTASGSGNISDTLNMPTGSSVTYTVNATIKSSATGSLSNTATVTAPGGVTDPNTANNSATDTDTLVPTADLSITKTDGVTSKVPGTSVTYTIVVSNSGPSDAPGTAVADTFSSDLTGVTFTSLAAGGATGNTASGSGNITDTVSLPSGSSVTYTVNGTVKASATGSLSNTATVTEAAGVTDNNQANNSATDTDTLTPQADLSITKTDGLASAVPGATNITYTITVSNSGPSDAPGTSVADTFPGILTGVSYTSVAAGGATGNTAGPANGNINDTVSMPAGSSITYTVHASIIPSATGTLSNTATVTAGGGVTDPTPGNNSATDTDTLTPSADVAVDKTGDASVTPGNNITYTITVTNSGPSDAVNLSLSDAVPTNTTLVSVTTPAGWTRTDAVPAGGTGTLTFTRASFAAGDAPSVFTLVVTANLGLPDATVITNTANVSSATADPNAANNTDSATTTVQNNADLSITKHVSPTGPNAAGSSVTYTIVVTNNGPSASANNVTFSDGVPAGLTVTSQTNPSGWSCNSVVGSNGTITCTKATVAKDETATLTVVAKIGCNVANGATISNSATVSAASPADGDTSNNTANASFTVTNQAPTLTASLATSMLPQNNANLVNVGLSASASDGPCGSATITVQVFGDEDDQAPSAGNVFSPDAKNIAPGTLRLRQERTDSGDGRVYLIVVKATDGAGQTSFKTFTVTVPKNQSGGSISSVNAQAAAAKAFADSHNGAPPAGYFVIGDGPVIGNKQ